MEKQHLKDKRSLQSYIENFPLIDLDQVSRLREMNDSSNQFSTELLEIWENTASNIFKDMKSAIKDNSIDTIISLSHKFKGSCSNIGAKRLSIICHIIEDNCHQYDIETIKNLWNKVVYSYSESKKEISSSLKY